MKIIRVTTFLDFGGVEKRFVNISKIPSSHEIVFIALGKGGWAEKEILAHGKRAICLQRRPQIPNFALILTLLRLFLKEKPAVVHTSGAEANFHGLIAAWIARVPVRIGEEIGYPNHHVIYRLLFKLIYRAAHRIVGISQAVVDKIIDLREVPAHKTAVIYNPLPFLTSEKPQFRNGSVRIITVCRLFSIKNLEVLLRIVKDLGPHFPLELWIVGDGPERSSLEALSQDLGLAQSVTFFGFQENPIPYLLQCDIFALPSYSEGLSNSLLEAMALGLPCIVTQTGGPSELIENGKTGWLIDPLDYENIKTVFTAVLKLSETERIAVGLRAREFVEDKLSLAAHEAELEKVYSSV